MKSLEIDITKVKFLLDNSQESIDYAAELIEIEIKTVEYMLSGGYHTTYEE